MTDEPINTMDTILKAIGVPPKHWETVGNMAAIAIVAGVLIVGWLFWQHGWAPRLQEHYLER
jgi:hypothetical protein